MTYRSKPLLTWSNQTLTSFPIEEGKEDTFIACQIAFLLLPCISVVGLKLKEVSLKGILVFHLYTQNNSMLKYVPWIQLVISKTLKNHACSPNQPKEMK